MAYTRYSRYVFAMGADGMILGYLEKKRTKNAGEGI